MTGVLYICPYVSSPGRHKYSVIFIICSNEIAGKYDARYNDSNVNTTAFHRMKITASLM